MTTFCTDLATDSKHISCQIVDVCVLVMRCRVYQKQFPICQKLTSRSGCWPAINRKRQLTLVRIAYFSTSV